ncbi:PfkB family carbohydrate kinase [Pedobacter sp. JCM 36344]|uniref:PfkB family carbohydrate kinase n=1 Tax=Pedobacter sp. JCM 36344 TaxID=3374280 RepID=UPI0039791EEE
MRQNHNILVFGELLIRLSSKTNDFLNNEQGATLYPGGSEANVAASLAHFGKTVSYVTAAPENALTSSALKELSDISVNTTKVLQQGSRLGLYFLLSANGLSNGEVIYDRKYSSFSSLVTGSINWDELMKGHTWFHWSALTPALNGELALVMLEALQAANRNGLKISVDLNYRSRLWDYGKQPIEVMPSLVQYCHVIMGNIWAADKMLGAGIDETLNRSTTSSLYFKVACNSAENIFKTYPNCEHIANTFRFMDNPKHNLFYGTYHTKNDNFISEVLETEEVIDRIGSGDAFMAGLIHGLVDGLPGKQIIERATAAGFRKLFVKGDFGDGSL